MSNIMYVLSTNGILLLLSIIFNYFPPKKINNWYGYRTHKSMLNQDIWNFANSTFNKSFVIYSMLSFVGGVIIAYGSIEQLTWQPMVLVFLSIAVCIVKTERELKENFNENGKRIKKSKNSPK